MTLNCASHLLWGVMKWLHRVMNGDGWGVMRVWGCSLWGGAGLRVKWGGERVWELQRSGFTVPLLPYPPIWSPPMWSIPHGWLIWSNFFLSPLTIHCPNNPTASSSNFTPPLPPSPHFLPQFRWHQHFHSSNFTGGWPIYILPNIYKWVHNLRVHMGHL